MRLVNQDRIAVAALSVAAATNVFVMLLTSEITYGYTLGFAAVSPYFRFAATGSLGLLLLVQWVMARRIVVDPLSIFLLAYLVLGLLFGASNPNKYEYFRHAFAALTMFGAYACGVACGDRILDKMGTLRFWSWVTLVAAAVTVALILPNMHHPSFTLSPRPVLLPLDIGLLTGSAPLIAIALIYVVFGNSRSVLFSAAIMVSLFLLRRWKVHAVPRLLAAGIGAVGLVIAASLFVSGVNSVLKSQDIRVQAFSRADRVSDAVRAIDHPPAAASHAHSPAPAKKSQPAAPEVQAAVEQEAPTGSPTYQWLERFSSNRLSLAEAAVSSLETWRQVIFGQGFGASYEWRYWSPNVNDWQTRTGYQIDLALLWFLITGGVVFAILIPATITIQVVNLAISDPLRPGTLLVVGMSFAMVLTFTPNSAIYWVFLGALSAGSRFAVTVPLSGRS